MSKMETFKRPLNY